MIEERGRSMTKREALRKMIGLLLILDELDELGKNDSSLADAIRDEMDGPHSLLSEGGRKLAEMASEILMREGDHDFEPKVGDAYSKDGGPEYFVACSKVKNGERMILLRAAVENGLRGFWVKEETFKKKWRKV